MKAQDWAHILHWPIKPWENTKWAFPIWPPERERKGADSQEATCLNLSWGNASGPIFLLISGNQKWRFFWRHLEKRCISTIHCIWTHYQFFHFKPPSFLTSFALYLITILSKLMALLEGGPESITPMILLIFQHLLLKEHLVKLMLPS